MTNGICPKCRCLRNLISSISSSETITSDRKIDKIIFTSYHCAVCNQFIKTEKIIKDTKNNS